MLPDKKVSFRNKLIRLLAMSVFRIGVTIFIIIIIKL